MPKLTITRSVENSQNIPYILSVIFIIFTLYVYLGTFFKVPWWSFGTEGEFLQYIQIMLFSTLYLMDFSSKNCSKIELVILYWCLIVPSVEVILWHQTSFHSFWSKLDSKIHCSQKIQICIQFQRLLCFRIDASQNPLKTFCCLHWETRKYSFKWLLVFFYY